MRSRLPQISLLLVTLATLPTCGESPRPRAPRNLLLITIDTLRADRLGVYGSNLGLSPNIDALARSGTTFDDAISPSSWTLPAMASLITSTYPSTHGVVNYTARLNESFTTLPELLVAAKFRAMGITSHVFVGPRHGISQGIEAFDDELVADGKQSENVITSPEITARGIKWLRDATQRDDRWMLWLHYFDPHHPYMSHDPAGPSRESVPPGDPREEDLYHGEISFTDRAVGEIVAELQTLGVADETVIVLVSDHGEEFWDRGKLRHGYTLFREQVHVPLVIRAPGITPSRVEETVRTVDVMPTLLDLLGLPPARVQEGSSLVGAMRGDRVEPQPAISELRLHDEYPLDSIQFGRWKLILDPTGRSTVGFAETPGGPPRKRSTAPNAPSVDQPVKELLFDLDVDSAERNNVAADHSDVVSRLRTMFEKQRERALKLAEQGGYEDVAPIEYSEEEMRELRELGYVR